MSQTKDGFHGEYRFLSNFSVCPIEVNGKTFQTAEHAYQASKFNEQMIIEEIRQANYPGRAKQLARKFKSSITEEFHRDKVVYMADILKLKFECDEYRWLLLSTGDTELVEINDWGDEFWGVDKTSNCGLNMLGRLLMLERNRCWHQEFQEFCIYKMSGGLISLNIIKGMFKDHIKLKADQSRVVVNNVNGWTKL